MESVDNVTIYVPVPDPVARFQDQGARRLVRQDQGKTWDDWMLRGQKPAAAECDVPEASCWRWASA